MQLFQGQIQFICRNTHERVAFLDNILIYCEALEYSSNTRLCYPIRQIVDLEVCHRPLWRGGYRRFACWDYTGLVLVLTRKADMDVTAAVPKSPIEVRQTLVCISLGDKDKAELLDARWHVDVANRIVFQDIENHRR